MEVLVDTTFLIDTQRKHEGALQWIGARPFATFYLCPTAYAEYRSGFPDRDATEVLLATLPTVALDFEVADLWGLHSRAMKAVGLRIGQNDLWIACTALRHGLPVVTRNVREFSRVPGLHVLDY